MFNFDIIPEETYVCQDKECLEKILNENGTENLKSVFRIDYDIEIIPPEVSISGAKVKRRITIEGID